MNSKVVVLVSGGYNLEKEFVDALSEYSVVTIENDEYEKSLSGILRQFGWNGKRDKSYFDCISEIRQNISRVYDYDYQNLAKKLTEFFTGESDILIVKNYTSEIESAVEGYDLHDFQLIKINIVRESNKNFDDKKCDYTFVFDKNFKNNVSDLFNKLFRSELLTTHIWYKGME